MYTINGKRIVVFGGTGFIGRELISRLVRGGAYVTLLARHPERHQELGVLSRLRIMRGDVRDAACVGQALSGQDAAINLVGVLDGPPKQMQALHVDWPKRLVESGRELQRIVHVSAVNADPQGPSRYIATKGQGEERIRRSQAPWTIVAPSTIFGPGDTLFNRFATLLRLIPFVMPVARPRARFTPVYVGDVAEAIVRAMVRPDCAGRRLALGGPEEWTLHNLFAYVRREIGAKRLLIDLPDPLARLEGALLGLVPGAPFSLEQFRTLCVDAVAGTEDLRELGIEPAAVDAVVPGYLGPRRRQILYDRMRRHAGGASTPTR